MPWPLDRNISQIQARRASECANPVECINPGSHLLAQRACIGKSPSAARPSGRNVLAILIGAAMVLNSNVTVGQTAEEQLKAIVAKQAADWNRGDIHAFMQAYWNSEQLTFSSGGKTERGWQATRKRYLEQYPTQKEMGRLEFSALETHSLGPDAALMLGEWKLLRQAPVAGNFTLVWRKLGNQWVIVHDHTSVR